MTVCDHQPSMSLTRGAAFITSISCRCVKCGEQFMWRPSGVTPDEPPRLRLLPPKDAA